MKKNKQISGQINVLKILKIVFLISKRVYGDFYKI